MVMGSMRRETDVVVVGGGPGGYVAAIRAADLGLEVVLVEEREQLGGVCLLEGCIPSKTLIHLVELAESVKGAEKQGLRCEKISFDRAALQTHSQTVIRELSKGIDGLLKKRGVDVVRGRARLRSAHELMITGGEVETVAFKHCILATGSHPTPLPMAKDMGIWSSREALALTTIPERLLVVGGGYIGLELGLVYAGLGSQVTLVELLPQLLSGADPDLVEPVKRACAKRFAAVLLETKVKEVKRQGESFSVTLEGGGRSSTAEFDQVLVSIGRTPNTAELGLDQVGITCDQRRLIPVNEQMRTCVPSIFAIGDIVAGPGLAHKASREGKVAAEVIAGRPAAFDNVAIPAVVFTDPEVAWAGLTEGEAAQRGLAIKVSKFPLAALGRARSVGRMEGLVKIITDAQSQRLLGVGIVGLHASELIAEAVLALEMGAVIEDLTATIHPHPTFAESLMEAAEVAEGLPIHLLPQKR